ncbi:MAG: YcxB family protein [Rhodospirillaceae bacterium]
MTEGALEVSFEQTLDDPVALSKFLLRESSTARWQRWTVRAAYPVIAIGAAAVWWAVAGADPLVFGLIAMATVVFTPLLWNRYDQAMAERVRQQLGTGRNLPLIGPTRLVVSADGIERVTAHSQARVGWTAVERIESDGERVFFFVGAASAYVVSPGAFADRTAFEHFLSEARRLRGV